MDFKFYRCNTCGNIICKVVDSEVVPECCGSSMVLLEPKSADNGVERHLPSVCWLDYSTLKVNVGSMPHPCNDEHFIVMVALLTKEGINIKVLKPHECQGPETVFKCCKCTAVGVYAYCNLHGLWYLPL